MTADPCWRPGATERRRASSPGALAFALDRRRLRIGLVNNMPDAALVATERQFKTLVQAAAPDRRIELQLLHLPGAPRGEAARARLDALYRPAESLEGSGLEDGGLDALIVTGAEPCAPDLRADPMWPGFARLVGWASDAGLPTLFSCLAAHAAVLRLDGVQRRPLAAKCSGLYACRAVCADPLTEGLSREWVTPHSRNNTLEEAELAAHGYRILSRSDEAGVDAFARGRFLFLQGHPEYDPNSLALEFKRDLQRYLDGQRPTPPALPRGVFDPRTVERLQALLADAGPRHPDLMSRWPRQAEITLAENTWRAPAAALYRNWLASGAPAAGAQPTHG